MVCIGLVDGNFLHLANIGKWSKCIRSHLFWVNALVFLFFAMIFECWLCDELSCDRVLSCFSWHDYLLLVLLLYLMLIFLSSLSCLTTFCGIFLLIFSNFARIFYLTFLSFFRLIWKCCCWCTFVLVYLKFLFVTPDKIAIEFDKVWEEGEDELNEKFSLVPLEKPPRIPPTIQLSDQVWWSNFCKLINRFKLIEIDGQNLERLKLFNAVKTLQIVMI